MNIGELFDLLEDKLKTGEFSRLDDLDTVGYPVDSIEKVSGTTVRVYLDGQLPDCSNCFESCDDDCEVKTSIKNISKLAETVCNFVLEHGNIHEEAPEVESAADELIELLEDLDD